MSQDRLFRYWKAVKAADMPTDAKRRKLIRVQQKIIARMPQRPWVPGPTVLGVRK